MGQQIFVSSSKASAAVMTSDSRDTQKQGRAAYSRSRKNMALRNIFVHCMQRVVYTSNAKYVTSFICQKKLARQIVNFSHLLEEIRK